MYSHSGTRSTRSCDAPTSGKGVWYTSGWHYLLTHINIRSRPYNLFPCRVGPSGNTGQTHSPRNTSIQNESASFQENHYSLVFESTCKLVVRDMDLLFNLIKVKQPSQYLNSKIGENARGRVLKTNQLM